MDKVVASTTERGAVFYKIRWRGFTADDDSREPEVHLSCAEAIHHYKVNEEAASALAQC